MQVMTFPVNSACKLEFGSSDEDEGDDVGNFKDDSSSAMLILDESVSCHESLHARD